MVRVAILCAVLAGISGEHPLFRFPPETRATDAIRNPAVRPVLRESRPPEYTAEAKKARISGVVVLEIVVERDGRVSGGRVLKPLPMGLTQKAIDAVRHYRYTPGKNKKGKPVRTLLNVTMPFRL